MRRWATILLLVWLAAMLPGCGCAPPSKAYRQYRKDMRKDGYRMADKPPKTYRRK